jgi:ParB family transcriptional regulator, chromosome partitioning protein
VSALIDSSQGLPAERLVRDCGSFVIADPFRCRIWTLNERIEDDVTEASCRAEIESVARDGQLVPVIGRALSGNPDFDIEVICGTRRLFIARHLKIPLRVEIRELTDRQAAVAVETENSLRKRTSPYERGLWLAKLLKQKLYRSQDEMARELGITPTQVTRLLKFAELPAIVIGAFSSPHDILESWAVELHKFCGDERRRLVTERARALEKRVPRPPAVSVYEMLLASRGQSARSRRRGAGHVVKSPTGEPLLRFERQRKEVVLRIPNALVDPSTEQLVTQAVVAVLTRWTADERTTSAA